MAAEPRQREYVECKTPEGRLLAIVEIVTLAKAEPLSVGQKSLVLFAAEEARRNSEERLQLRERGRYEYRLKPVEGAPDDLSLLRDRGVQPSPVLEERGDRGLIEPQDYCGLLPLTVIRRSDTTLRPLARGGVEVRSVKLGYREHYRGMLSFIADKCAGLLLDCRAPTRLKLDTLWQKDSRILEQQLEFLRHTLESSPFRAAVDEILRNPHRRLEDNREERDISRPFKPGRDFGRQVAMAVRRVAVPESHPLHSTIKSLPARVSVQSRTDFLDTAENRFVKMVLAEFRDFLADIVSHLKRKPSELEKPETLRLLADANRLRGMLETQLGRGFLPDVSPPAVVPLGSSALQRKAGYRELLHFWLQFHAGSQLVWEGATDVFEAGARNVATLYEYWLFFQLEKLFRQRFTCEKPLHSIVVDKDKSPPQLMLKRGIELRTPVAGVWSNSASRRLKAEFHFNRKFSPRSAQGRAGSWTRGVQPDYTISIWPADYSREEAERNELMAHIHFDAKYRVDRVRELLGDAADDEAFEGAEADAAEESRTAAKYSDLLKMHAYRDAIRRTAGAYVLYPGNPNDGIMYGGYHEVLPGLGAFAIRPNAEGGAEGIDALAKFLDDIIDHLANRTTARERAAYHLAESYSTHEKPVQYGSMPLSESDSLWQDHRALPPAEEMVLLAWYANDAQLELARDPNGFVYIRLGRRQGSFHVHPNLAKLRSVILHTGGGLVAPGFVNLREPGFRVFTRSQLRTELKQHAKGQGVAAWEAFAGMDDEEHIYALFKTAGNSDTEPQEWNSDALLDQIEIFESDARNKPVANVGRTSPYPRILPLRSVLKAIN